MRFSNVSFPDNNTISYTDEAGVPQTEDFFLMLIRWARKEKGVDFDEEIGQIDVDPNREEPLKITFMEALRMLPKLAHKSAVLKSLELINPGYYKAVPRRAPTVVKRLGKKRKIRIQGTESELFETILNCVLGDAPIPRPQRRERKSTKPVSAVPAPAEAKANVA
jgi:hypothetical protein